MTVKEAEEIVKPKDSYVGPEEAMNIASAAGFMACHELYKPLVEALEHALRVALLNENVDGAHTGQNRVQIESALYRYRKNILGDK